MTLKLYEQGVLSPEDLRSIAESPEPINPLAARTSISTNANAIRAFGELIKLGISKESWASVQGVVHEALGSAAESARTQEVARVETGALLDPAELPPEPGFIGAWPASDGRILGLFIVPGNRVAIRDLVATAEIWRSEDLGDYVLAGLSEDQEGNLRLNVLRNSSPPSFWENLKNYLTAAWFEREIIEVKSGKSVKQTFPFTYFVPERARYIGSKGKADAIEINGNVKALLTAEGKLVSCGDRFLSATPGNDGRILAYDDFSRVRTRAKIYFSTASSDGLVKLNAKAFRIPGVENRIHGIQLRDGQFAVVGTTLSSETTRTVNFAKGRGGERARTLPLNPEAAFPDLASVFESSDRRVLVAAHSYRAGMGQAYLDVYEPEKNLEPIEHFDLVHPLRSKVYFFEREHVIYGAALNDHRQIVIFTFGGGTRNPIVIDMPGDIDPKKNIDFEIVKSGIGELQVDLILYTEGVHYGYSLFQAQGDRQ